MKVVLGYYERTNHVQTWHMAFWNPVDGSGAQRGRHDTMCDYGGMFHSPSKIKWSSVMADSPIEIVKFVREAGRAPMSRACRSCLKVLTERISAVDRLAEITKPTAVDFIRGQR